jgi:hypothetical protein
MSLLLLFKREYGGEDTHDGFGPGEIKQYNVIYEFTKPKKVKKVRALKKKATSKEKKKVKKAVRQAIQGEPLPPLDSFRPLLLQLLRLELEIHLFDLGQRLRALEDAEHQARLATLYHLIDIERMRVLERIADEEALFLYFTVIQ